MLKQAQRADNSLLQHAWSVPACDFNRVHSKLVETSSLRVTHTTWRNAAWQETRLSRVKWALVARQDKTVTSLERNSPFASLVLVRRDVMIGGGVEVERRPR
jgi:hypothetical protein